MNNGVKDRWRTEKIKLLEEVNCIEDIERGVGIYCQMEHNCYYTLQRYLNLCSDKYLIHMKNTILSLEGKKLIKYFKDQNKRNSYTKANFNFWVLEDTKKKFYKTKTIMSWHMLVDVLYVIESIENILDINIWNDSDFTSN